MILHPTQAPVGVFHVEIIPSTDGTVFVTISGIRPDENHGKPLEDLHGSGRCGTLNGALLEIGLAIGSEMDMKRIAAPPGERGKLFTDRVRNALIGKV